MRAAAIPVAALFVSLPAFGQTPEELLAAARGGEVEEVRRLVEAGVPVDATDRYGSTALLMAAGHGQVEVTRELLARGADPNHRESFFGADALGMALLQGHGEVAKLLLAGGANDRAAALQLALQRNDIELARAAVASGPIYESRLQAFRARATALDTDFQTLIAAARSRPDPEPPTLTGSELEPFVGAFEGWDSDTRIEVSLEGDRLTLSIDGGNRRRLVAAAERSFRSVDGEVEASFSGRAGTIEGVVVRLEGAPPLYLRRSVAEPVGSEGFSWKEAGEPKIDEATVHWPSFRGANAAGIGDGLDTSTSWNLETGDGVLWSVELPGLGNSSPIVWGEKVFVTTAVAEGMEQRIRTGLTGAIGSVDEKVPHSWRVLAFDKRSGKRLWETEVGRGVPLTKRHFKATQANSTPATDGRHLVTVFPTAGLACLDLEGGLVWKRELGGLNAGAFSDPGIQWGFASSPILHGATAILQVDTHEGAYLAAWELETGRLVWRSERDVAPSWSTPAMLDAASGRELVVNGSVIHGYDPDTGEELWSLGPNSELVIAAPVVGDGVVYVSAGYPPVKPIYAVRAGTRGDLEVDPRGNDKRLLWSHGIGGAYMPTPLLYRGLYYIVHHNGRLVAYDARSGVPIFKSRFSRGGVFTASPVAVNGKLYLPTEEGLLYILAAGPEYEEIAVHEFGEPLMATPAISEGMLFFRTPSKLIAIGKD